MDLDYLLSSRMVNAQEQIISHLGPKDFLILERTSKNVRTSTKEAKEHVVHNIDKKLKKYFDDPRAFRCVQARTGILIGDEFARRFFANQLSKELNELHLYIVYCAGKREKNRAALFEYLESSGWRPCLGLDSQSSTSTTFFHDSRAMADLTILVHCNYCSGLARLLCDASTTASLNFISWNKAYALFPRESFVENQAYLLKNLTDVVSGETYRISLKELKKHGTNVKTRSWDDGPDDTDSKIAMPRRIGNTQTWTITLATSNIYVLSSRPDNVIESSVFAVYKLGYSGVREPINRYHLDASPIFNHAILKHTYLSVTEHTKGKNNNGISIPRDLAEDTRELDNKLNDVTKLELLQLDEGKRPEQYDQIFDPHYQNSAIELFMWKEDQIPEGWSFFDGELVNQLDKLWKKHERKEAIGAA
jgi:hypothetical protein